MSDLRFRFPDKPLQIYDLSDFNPAEYLVQAKLDGWRAVVQIDSNHDVHVLSRVNKPLSISPEIVQAVIKLDIPGDTWFDCEWVARRKATQDLGIGERLYFFGLFYFGGEWRGNVTEEERFQMVKALSAQFKPPLYLVPHVDGEITGFVESTKKDWLTEGVVLKHKQAKLIGDLHTCKKNPLYLKYKWRQGCSGDNVAFSE